jgi:hypothetical protein
MRASVWEEAHAQKGGVTNMSRTKGPALPTRLPNATKHGAFSRIALFPGEDRGEFERLCAAVVDEYRPAGPTEEDAVFTIATVMWRKRRQQMYIAAKTAERQNSREQAARSALGALLLEPDSIARVLKTCAPDIRERVEKKFPAGDSPTESGWNAAMRDYLAVLLRSELIPPDGEAVPEPEPDPYDLTAAFFAPRSSEVSDEDLLESELKVIERMDAVIDRAVKRLVQIRTMKQLLVSPNLYTFDPAGIPFSRSPESTSRTRKGAATERDLS